MATMSSPLAVKRRKLNESSKVLSKPFVSPLKTSKSDPTTLEREQNAAPYTPYRPSMLAHTIAVAPTSASITAPASKPQDYTAKKSTPIRRPLTALTNSRTKDPAEIAAQKVITSLELRIRTVRNEIDTLSQAGCLRTSSRDSELEDVALKWKAAAQNAAEEVFATVKDRVQTMGGVRAWRESESQKWDRMNHAGEFAGPAAEEDNDEDCEFDSQGEQLPEEEAEWRKSEKRRVRKEQMEAMEDEGGDFDADGGDEIGRKDRLREESDAEDNVSVYLLVRFQVYN